jgi:hypothetical protein
MKLFNRNKDTTTTTDQAYYPQRRVGMAWLLGIATLVLTILLALGFFYGGRWVYRTVFDNDSSNTASDEQSDGTVELDGLSIDGDTSEPSATSDDNDVDDDDDDIFGSDTDEEASSDSGTSSANDTASPLPNSGPSELPSTGPSGPAELQ